MHIVVVNFNLPHRTGVGIGHTKAFGLESQASAQFFRGHFERVLQALEDSVFSRHVAAGVYEVTPIESETDVVALVRQIVDELVAVRRLEVERVNAEFLGSVPFIPGNRPGVTPVPR